MKEADHHLLLAGLPVGVYTGQQDGPEPQSLKSRMQETQFSLYPIMLVGKTSFCNKVFGVHKSHLIPADIIWKQTSCSHKLPPPTRPPTSSLQCPHLWTGTKLERNPPAWLFASPTQQTLSMNLGAR